MATLLHLIDLIVKINGHKNAAILGPMLLSEQGRKKGEVCV